MRLTLPNQLILLSGDCSSAETTNHRLPVPKRVILRPPRISYWTGGFFYAPKVSASGPLTVSLVPGERIDVASHSVLLHPPSGWV